MKAKSLLRALALALVALPFAAVPSWAGDDWAPVDPAQLKMTESQVEPGADAEAIFWDVRVEDQVTTSQLRTILSHYLRVKIFTDHGKETQSQIDIPYYGNTRISDIAGRTIKPDGTIVMLKPDAVFDRTIVKLGGVKVKAKSFAMPAVDPGCVVEYRWKETRGDEIADHVRLQFQRDIPIQRVTYHIKPLDIPGLTFGMKSRKFHLENSPFEKEPGGFWATSAKNVPAFREEPYMPAEAIVRPWMLVYYSEETKNDPQKYWTENGKTIFNNFKGSMKVNDDVKKAAAQIVGDASAPDDKLKRIYDFCRTQIKNVSDDASGLTAEQREALKDNKNPWDTLSRKQGTNGDINALFASLATAAGFDARIAFTASHDDMAFDPEIADTYFLDLACIAVKVGDGWRFCDPSEMYRPYGMLDWRAEGQQALVTDAKAPLFVPTPVTDADKSVETRTAKLTLFEDGTLDGDVRVEYTGQLAAQKKEYNDDDSAEQREETIRDEVKKHASTAEVTDVKVENVTDPDKPFACSYHVHIPGYAQRTGKRLFVQPSFFEYNAPALFTAPDRQYTVSFQFPWTVKDDVTINLPKGYALDNADAPASISAGKIGGYDVKLTAAKDNGFLHLSRTFFFGGGGALYFPADAYKQVRTLFDTIHAGDSHTITIKQQAATATATPAGGN